VLEVVLRRHVFAVALRGRFEPRVFAQRALAAAFAHLVDEAHHRGAHARQVPRLGNQVRVVASSRRAGGATPGGPRDGGRHSRAAHHTRRQGSGKREANSRHARLIGSSAREH